MQLCLLKLRSASDDVLALLQARFDPRAPVVRQSVRCNTYMDRFRALWAAGRQAQRQGMAAWALPEFSDARVGPIVQVQTGASGATQIRRTRKLRPLIFPAWRLAAALPA